MARALEGDYSRPSELWKGMRDVDMALQNKSHLKNRLARLEQQCMAAIRQRG